MTDANRNVVERREYEPYGLPRAPIADGPGYTGHDHDGDSGLVYAQQRYYDPRVGQFLSVDPVGVNTNSTFNFNRYNYAANNPYKFVDPDGRLIRNRDCASFIDCNSDSPFRDPMRSILEERCRATCLGGDDDKPDIAESVGRRLDDMFDVSVSFGVQAGLEGKVGPLASLGGELSLFALEWDGVLNYQGVSQGVGLSIGMAGFGEGEISSTRRGPGAPDGPWETKTRYSGFSQNAEGDFVLGAGLSLFIGVSIEWNITQTIKPFVEESK